MATGTVTVNIIGDASRLRSALAESDTALGRFSDKASSFGDSMLRAGARMTIGITAPIAVFGKIAFDELNAANSAAAQTEAVLKSTGGAANVTAKHIDDLATSIMNYSGMDDEAVKQGENLLLTFTNIRNEAGKGNDIFDRAVRLSADLSKAWGEDMHTASIQLGKALNDPIAGLTSLQKVGVQFSQSQRDLIKSLVDSGDTMGAQKVILQELERQVGGSAKAYGDTLAGQVDKSRESLKNSSADILREALPTLSQLVGMLADVVHWFSTLPGPVKDVILVMGGLLAVAGPLATGIGAISSAVGAVASAVPKMQSGITTLLNVALNPWLLTAGLVAGAVYGISQALDANSAKIDVNMQKLRQLNDEQLRNMILKLQDAADKLGVNNALHDAFSTILSQDTAQAQRFIDALAGTGANTAWYTGKLVEHIAAQQRTQAETEASRRKVEDLGNFLNWLGSLNPQPSIYLDTSQAYSEAEQLAAYLRGLTAQEYRIVMSISNVNV